MTLTINGKEYELYFGLDFIAYLDKKYTIEAQGIAIGAGVVTATLYLQMGNPTAIAEMIAAGLCTEKPQPSRKEIVEYVEGASEAELEELTQDFLSELEKSTLTARLMKMMRNGVPADPESQTGV